MIITGITAGAGMLRPPHRDKAPEKEQEQLPTFVSSDERAETFGHGGKQIYIAGEDSELARSFAKQLERELHRLKAHTYGLDFKAEGRVRARRNAVFSFAFAGGRMRSAVSGAETTFPSQMQ